MTLITGLSVALIRPKISATTSSVPTLDQPLPAGSVIPETTQVATPRAAAETSSRIRNLIFQILLDYAVRRVGRECGPGGDLWRRSYGAGQALRELGGSPRNRRR